MPDQLSENEILRMCRNENPHTEHVTELALTLFDGARAALRLSAADREILRVAARLHDIGFDACPDYHARYAARTILDRGLRGFSEQRRKLVSAAVILHSGDWRRYLRHPIVADLRSRRHALKLAAILRVADGLDHCHVQDAEIVSVRRRGNSINVAVRCAVYPGNVLWAERKSDLWREEIPMGLAFELLPRPAGKPLFAGLIDPGDSVLAAARKILALQFRVIRDHAVLALEQDDPEHLHEIRVAIRRFRAGLRLFRPHLEGSRAHWLNSELKALAVRLSPNRDFDVWLAFLQRPRVRKIVAGSAGAALYVDSYRSERAAHLEELRSILRGPETRRVIKDIAHFVRVEPPFHGGSPPDQPIRAYTARGIKKLLKSVLAHRHLTGGASAEDAHELRRLVRRGRYWAEFAAPAFEPFMQRLAQRFQALADALGDVHDMDVFEARSAEDDSPAAKDIQRLTKNLRRRYWSDFGNAWDKLDDKSFRKRTIGKLREAIEAGY